MALGTTIVGLAQGRPLVPPHRREASRADMEAALRTEESRMWAEQKAEPNPEDPWAHEQLIHPEELLKQMSSPERPLVLHIGVAFLFNGGHIPGSKYVGVGSTAEGVDGLKKAVQGLPLNQGIVLYCGCCPWKDCPNIRPAFRVLREMRFTKVKVLYLPNSLAQDWAEEGLPIEKGKSRQ